MKTWVILPNSMAKAQLRGILQVCLEEHISNFKIIVFATVGNRKYSKLFVSNTEIIIVNIYYIIFLYTVLPVIK